MIQLHLLMPRVLRKDRVIAPSDGRDVHEKFKSAKEDEQIKNA